MSLPPIQTIGFDPDSYGLSEPSTGQDKNQSEPQSPSDPSEQKYSNQAITATETGNDRKKVSDCVKNPQIYYKQIYDRWTNLWLDMATTIKFELNKKKMTLSAMWFIKDGFFNIDWILFRNVKQGRKIERRYTQALIPHARYSRTSKSDEIVIVLKNERNTDLIADVKSSFEKQGVNCEKITLTKAEVEKVKDAQQEEARREQERREQEARKQMELAERKRLPPIRKPPSWEEQDYLANAHMMLGEVQFEDFVNNVQDDDEESDQTSAQTVHGHKQDPEVDKQEITKEQWRRRGLAAFQKDNVHPQVWLFYQNVVKFFESIRPVHGKKSGDLEIESVIWIVNDLEFDFETSFDVITEAKGCLLHVFPVTSDMGDGKICVRSFETKTFIKIQNPEFFSLIGHMAEKQGKYVFHKSLLAANETSAKFKLWVRGADERFVKSLALCIKQFRQGTQQNEEEAINDIYLQEARKQAIAAASNTSGENSLELSQTVNGAAIIQQAAQAGSAYFDDRYSEENEQDLRDVPDPDGLFS